MYTCYCYAHKHYCCLHICWQGLPTIHRFCRVSILQVLPKVDKKFVASCLTIRKDFSLCLNCHKLLPSNSSCKLQIYCHETLTNNLKTPWISFPIFFLITHSNWCNVLNNVSSRLSQQYCILYSIHKRNIYSGKKFPIQWWLDVLNTITLVF